MTAKAGGSATTRDTAGATEGTGTRPLRADARRNRARILEVAQQVFATEGINAPIDDIAGRAGVGVGTIYRHFPTKEALFQAIVVHRIESTAENIRAQLDAPDPGAAFFGLFHQLLEHSLMSKDLFDAMAASSGTDLTALSAQHGDSMLAALGDLLARAQRAGAVRPEVSAADVKGLMLGAHAIQRHHQDDPATAARLIDIICDGLRPPR